MYISLLLVTAARASFPVAGPVLPVPEPVAAVALGAVDGGVVVVGTAGGVRALSASTGSVTSEQLGIATEALILQDRDADGRPDVVGCGPAGLFWMPWPVGGLQPAIVLDAEPCVAVVALPGGPVASGSDVRVYADDGLGGVLYPPVRHPGSGPLLASRAGDLAWLSPGDTTFSELTAFGLGVLPVGGPATGLAPSTSGWMLAWDAQLRDTTGAANALADPPGEIATGDFDLDGAVDTAVAYPGLADIGIWTARGETRVAVSPGVTALATGDLEADGCLDVAVNDPSGVVVIRMTDCVPTTDADGDGIFTPEDCNDASDAVFPGAPEACNGSDDDCDGVVDEPGTLALSGPAGDPDEGEQALVFGAFDGCLPAGTVPTWSLDGAAACTFDALDAICTGPDQGSSQFTLAVHDADGILLDEAETTVTWKNVAPQMGVRTLYTVFTGTPEIFGLEADDVAADQVTFSASDLPSWIIVTPSGSMSVDAPFPVEADVVLVASDEDGGTSQKIITVVAESPTDSGDTGLAQSSGCNDDSGGCGEHDCGLGCGCGGGDGCGCGGCGEGNSAFLGAGVLGLVLARRRRDPSSSP